MSRRVSVYKLRNATDGIYWAVSIRGDVGRFTFITWRRAMRFADAVVHNRPYRDDGRL